MYSSRPSVLAVAETWLSDLYFNNEILPSGYSILRKDHPSQGGRVLIATAFHIPSCSLYSQSDPVILTIKLYLPSPVIFCVIYIPPSSSDSSWSSMLDYLTHLFTSVDLHVVVVGDFNSPDIYWPLLSASSSFFSQLCDLVFDPNLYQCVDQPTHIKGNILDLIITNSIDRISGVTIHQEPFSSSDPLPISFSLLDIKTYTSHQLRPLNFFNYAKADYHGMCDFLLDWDFSSCFDSLDIDVIWSGIKCAICMAISKCVPFVTTSCRHSHLPKWFDSNIRHNLECMRTFSRQCASNPSPHSRKRLSDLESVLKDKITKAKSAYESNLVLDYVKKKPSKLYDHIRTITNHSLIPRQVSLGQTLATTDEKKANLFNEYFFSVCSHSSSYPSIPPISTIPSLSVIDFSPSDVYSTLSGLDLSKTMGVDGIGPQILKFCALALYEPLHHLFCTSLTSAVIPSEWRLHCISPIYKSGDKAMVSNYWPVSLLCCVSKVLELSMTE